MDVLVLDAAGGWVLPPPSPPAQKPQPGRRRGEGRRPGQARAFAAGAVAAAVAASAASTSVSTSKVQAPGRRKRPASQLRHRSWLQQVADAFADLWDTAAAWSTTRKAQARSLTIHNVRQAFAAKGYRWQSNGLNLVGVRTTIRAHGRDTYEDFIAATYLDSNNRWQLKIWEGTTRPGAHYLANPLNPAGAAVLLPGQYAETFRLGRHFGRSGEEPYEALVQHRPVRVLRSRKQFGLNSRVDQGVFGLNIHRSSKLRQGSNRVGRWSAGCQVFRHSHDFTQFMKLCRAAALRSGNRAFTYTLLTEEELRAAEHALALRRARQQQQHPLAAFQKHMMGVTRAWARHRSAALAF
eukprot:jgi/Chlat1/4280/Chrsp29S04373